VETGQGTQESYQLMIGCNYVYSIYDGSNERIPFYDKISDDFVEIILEENSSLEVGVFNGLRINPKTGSHERLPKLEEDLASQFSEMVCKKLRQSPIVTIPIPPALSRN
jgi:hypothetical protein